MREGFLRNSKILVVDGDSRSRAFMRTVLTVSTDGMMEFAEAASAQAALKILQSFKPDLIIADWTNDSPDGLELLRRLRKGFRDVCRFSPYILVTEKTDPHHRTEARDAGVNRYLEKPVSVTELYEEIAAVLKKPQPFIRSGAYFGPDRRHRDSHYSGDERRLEQAVFISPPIPLDPPAAVFLDPLLEEPAA